MKQGSAQRVDFFKMGARGHFRDDPAKGGVDVLRIYFIGNDGVFVKEGDRRFVAGSFYSERYHGAARYSLRRRESIGWADMIERSSLW